MTLDARHPPNPSAAGEDNVHSKLGPVRALLWFGLAWGLFIALLSFVLPIVTAVSSLDGPQPRVSVFRAYGLVGLVPAAGMLAAVVLPAWLLAFGRHAPSRASLTMAEGVAGLIFIAGLLAPLVLRLPGLLILPVAVAIPSAALGSEVLRQSARFHTR
jgi:hypothetical protein